MILDIVYIILLLAGAAFLAAAVVGFVRLPSSVARLHAVGMAGTAGFTLIVLARITDAASLGAVAEYVIILLLGMVASATVAQAVAWAVRTCPDEGTDRPPPESDDPRTGP